MHWNFAALSFETKFRNKFAEMLSPFFGTVLRITCETWKPFATNTLLLPSHFKTGWYIAPSQCSKEYFPLLFLLLRKRLEQGVLSWLYKELFVPLPRFSGNLMAFNTLPRIKSGACWFEIPGDVWWLDLTRLGDWTASVQDTVVQYPQSVFVLVSVRRAQVLAWVSVTLRDGKKNCWLS